MHSMWWMRRPLTRFQVRQVELADLRMLACQRMEHAIEGLHLPVVAMARRHGFVTQAIQPLRQRARHAVGAIAGLQRRLGRRDGRAEVLQQRCRLRLRPCARAAAPAARRRSRRNCAGTVRARPRSARTAPAAGRRSGATARARRSHVRVNAVRCWRTALWLMRSRSHRVSTAQPSDASSSCRSSRCWVSPKRARPLRHCLSSPFPGTAWRSRRPARRRSCPCAPASRSSSVASPAVSSAMIWSICCEWCAPCASNRPRTVSSGRFGLAPARNLAISPALAVRSVIALVGGGVILGVRARRSAP